MIIKTKDGKYKINVTGRPIYSSRKEAELVLQAVIERDKRRKRFELNSIE